MPVHPALRSALPYFAKRSNESTPGIIEILQHSAWLSKSPYGATQLVVTMPGVAMPCRSWPIALLGNIPMPVLTMHGVAAPITLKGEHIAMLFSSERLGARLVTSCHIGLKGGQLDSTSPAMTLLFTAMRCKTYRPKGGQQKQDKPMRYWSALHKTG